MIKLHSIAARLAIGLTLGTAILWAGAAAIALFVLSAELTESFDQALEQSATRLLPLALHDIDEREEDETDEFRVVGIQDSDPTFLYYVRDRNGKPILLSDDVDEEDIFSNVPDGFSQIDGRRVLALKDQETGYAIVLVETENHQQDIFKEAAIALFWPLAGLVPLIGFGIWASVRLALRPLEKLRREIAERGTHNLNETPKVFHVTELAPIADEIDNLLKRLRAALDVERAFAASSAHELRTPIAGALAQIQQLALELKDDKAGDRIAEIERALRNLSDLSEKLLQLSRLDAGFATSDTSNDLMPALELVVRDAQLGGQLENQIHLEVDPDADLHIALNPDAFAIALSNLVQNALKHGDSSKIIDIIAGPGRSIRVINAGTTVDEQILQNLGTPYMRGDTLVPGNGLGLSIARSVVEQTHGVLSLHSPASGKADGFEAKMSW